MQTKYKRNMTPNTQWAEWPPVTLKIDPAESQPADVLDPLYPNTLRGTMERNAICAILKQWEQSPSVTTGYVIKKLAKEIREAIANIREKK